MVLEESSNDVLDSIATMDEEVQTKSMGEVNEVEISSEEDCYDCEDGGPPSHKQNLVNSFRMLSEKAHTVQTNIGHKSSIGESKMYQEICLLRKRKDDEHEGQEARIVRLRGNIADFRKLIDGDQSQIDKSQINHESNQSQIDGAVGQCSNDQVSTLLCCLHVCDGHLATYLETSQKKVTTEIEPLPDLETKVSSVECTTTACVGDSKCQAAPRNDVILTQVKKFCTQVLREEKKFLPENP